MSRQRRQYGFALLLTLLLVMVAAMALVAVARQSATKALAARDAADALSRRWAVTSCRATLLPRVEPLMQEADTVEMTRDDETSRDLLPPPRRANRWVSCELAGVRYELVMTDEQAKYNVQTIAAYYGKQDVRQTLRDFAESNVIGDDNQAMLVRLTPMVGRDVAGRLVIAGPNSEESEEVYAGFGQVFPGASPSDLLGTPDQPGPVAWVTLWGDGVLNINRAPTRVMDLVLEPILSDEGIDELIDEIERDPAATVRSLIDRLDRVDADRRVIAQNMVTQHSACFGLWVVAHGPTRSWYAFSVIDTTEPSRQLVNGGGIQGIDDPPVRVAMRNVPVSNGGATDKDNDVNGGREITLDEEAFNRISRLIETGNAGNETATRRLRNYLNNVKRRIQQDAPVLLEAVPSEGINPNAQADIDSGSNDSQDGQEQQRPRRFDFYW